MRSSGSGGRFGRRLGSGQIEQGQRINSQEAPVYYEKLQRICRIILIIGILCNGFAFCTIVLYFRNPQLSRIVVCAGMFVPLVVAFLLEQRLDEQRFQLLEDASLAHGLDSFQTHVYDLCKRNGKKHWFPSACARSIEYILAVKDKAFVQDVNPILVRKAIFSIAPYANFTSTNPVFFALIDVYLSSKASEQAKAELAKDLKSSFRSSARPGLIAQIEARRNLGIP